MVQTACVLPPAVCDRIRCDPIEPRPECNAAPLELAQMCERLLEHFRGDVLGGGAITRPASDEGVDAFDVPIVELSEPVRIGLRRFNQPPVIVCCRCHVSPNHDCS